MQKRFPSLLLQGLLAGALLPLVATAATISPTYAAGDVTPAGWHTQSSGDSTTYIPDDLKAGEIFSLILYPTASQSGRDLETFISEKLKSSPDNPGTPLGKSSISANTQKSFEMVTGVQPFRNASGTTELVAHIIVRRADGMARYACITSSVDKTVYNRYFPTAMRTMLSTLAAGNSGQTIASKTSGSKKGTSVASSSSRPSSRGADAYTTSVGAGLKQSQVFGIYSNMTQQMGVGGYFYPTYEPIIVLKDGTYYEDFDVPMDQFNVAAAKQSRPKAWGRWRKQGSTFQTYNDRKGIWEKAGWVGPLSGGTGEKLSGSYSHLSGGGNVAFGGGTMIAATREFTFFPDGHFRGGSHVGASSNEPMSDVSTVTSANKNYDGTYTLSGYTIIFRYADGKVDRRSFVYMDPGKKTAFYLNGSSYLPPRK